MIVKLYLFVLLKWQNIRFQRLNNLISSVLMNLNDAKRIKNL